MKKFDHRKLLAEAIIHLEKLYKKVQNKTNKEFKTRAVIVTSEIRIRIATLDLQDKLIRREQRQFNKNNKNIH